MDAAVREGPLVEYPNQLWNDSSVDGEAFIVRSKEAPPLAGLLLASLLLISSASDANATAAPIPVAPTPTAPPWPEPEPSRQVFTTGGSEGLPLAVVEGGQRTTAPSSTAPAIVGAMVRAENDSFFSLLAAIVGSVALLGAAGLWLICFLRERTRKRRDLHETAGEEPRRPASCKFPTSVAPSLGSFEDVEGDRASGQTTSNPLYASSGRGSERPLSASARTAIGTDYGEFKDFDLEGGDGNGDCNRGRSSGGSGGVNCDASDDPSSPSDWKPTETAVTLRDEGSIIAGAVEGNHSCVDVRGSGGGGGGGGAFAVEIASEGEFTRNRKKVNATTEMLDTVGSAFLVRPPPCSDRGGSGWRDSPAAPGASDILSPSLAVVTAASPKPRLGRSRTVSPTNASASFDYSSDFGRPVASLRGLDRGSSSRSLHGTGATNSCSVKRRPSLERIHSDGDHPSSHRQPFSHDGRTSSSSSSTSRRQRQRHRHRHRRQRGAEEADSLGESSIPARAAERVLSAAEALAVESIIPVVRESAEVAAGLARIAAEHQGKAREMDRRVRWCRALVRMLESAGEVLGQATAHDGEAERVLLEDVRECVADVMEIVRTYKSTSGVSKVFASGLCNRRRDEAEEAIDVAQQRLEVIMQVRAGNVVGTTGQPGDNGGSHRQWKTLKEILAQSKKNRRQRSSDEIEISAEEVEVMMDEVIGSGGSFGTVHLADYDGLNAAAKVVVLDPDTNEDDDDDSVSGHYRTEDPQSSRDVWLRRWSEEGSSDLTESGPGAGTGAGAGAPPSPTARARRAEQRALSEARRRHVFLREVEAMKKLRDPNVVRIYGGVVSARDRLVLVMELLPAGSLRHRLKRARRKLSERTLRRILADVCSGMAFLHAGAFVHGSFKSPNVLFDAGGKAKISDYGALLWAQHSSRLDTFSTAQGESIGVNLRWSSPEILNRERATAKSDVYSFGVILWECLTRQLPWKDLNGVDTLLLAVTRGERPTVPSDAPTDLVTLTRACWAQDPAARPTFKGILSDLRQAEGGASVGMDSRVAGSGGGGGGTTLSASLWPWSAWSSTPAAGEQVSEAGTPRTCTGERTASPEHFQAPGSSVTSLRRVGGEGDLAGGETSGGGGGGILWPFASRKKTGGSVSVFPAVHKRSEEAGGNEGRRSGGSKKLDEPPKPDRDLPALFRRLREEKSLVGCLSSDDESPPDSQPAGGQAVPTGRATVEDGTCVR